MSPLIAAGEPRIRVQAVNASRSAGRTRSNEKMESQSAETGTELSAQPQPQCQIFRGHVSHPKYSIPLSTSCIANQKRLGDAPLSLGFAECTFSLISRSSAHQPRDIEKGPSQSAHRIHSLLAGYAHAVTAADVEEGD